MDEERRAAFANLARLVEGTHKKSLAVLRTEIRRTRRMMDRRFDRLDAAMRPESVAALARDPRPRRRH